MKRVNVGRKGEKTDGLLLKFCYRYDKIGIKEGQGLKVEFVGGRMAELSGIVIVNKEAGMSSQAVVNRVKKIFGVKKAGHTGTLDPMATGVLPVLIGRAVKASEFMLTSDKHYGATLRLGITTDTEDITGEVLTRSEDIPDEEAVMTAVSAHIGRIMQTPPMYSALKVGGKKLYEMAREGKVIDRQAREITVYSIEAKRLSDTDYYLDIKCSKGTYIRTLCSDIGKMLGCGGAMATLERLSASGYLIKDSHTLGELENMKDYERENVVRGVEEIFSGLDIVRLPAFYSRLAHSGLEIYQKKIETNYPMGSLVRMYDEGGFFALGEVREYEDGLAIKPIRRFDL